MRREANGERLGLCRVPRPPPARLLSSPILPSRFLPPRLRLWLVVFFCRLLLFLCVSYHYRGRRSCEVHRPSRKPLPSMSLSSLNVLRRAERWGRSSALKAPSEGRLRRPCRAPLFSFLISSLLSIRAVLQRRMRRVGRAIHTRVYTCEHSSTGAFARNHNSTSLSHRLHDPLPSPHFEIGSPFLSTV